MSELISNRCTFSAVARPIPVILGHIEFGTENWVLLVCFDGISNHLWEGSGATRDDGKLAAPVPHMPYYCAGNRFKSKSFICEKGLRCGLARPHGKVQMSRLPSLRWQLAQASDPLPSPLASRCSPNSTRSHVSNTTHSSKRMAGLTSTRTQ